RLAGLARQSRVSVAANLKNQNRVFIVHGHDDGAKETVARLVEQLGPKAIILHEQASQGKTVIEKFEEYADCQFAIVLLTPDDAGSAKGANTVNDRARQNVVFELGYFFGRLGRQNVCALIKGDVEKPSDIHGLAYVQVDAAGAWRTTL